MQHTFESLIERLARAAASFSTVAADTPENLFATTPTPIPVPQNNMPRTPPLAPARAVTGGLHGARDRRRRDVVFVRAEIFDLEATHVAKMRPLRSSAPRRNRRRRRRSDHQSRAD